MRTNSELKISNGFIAYPAMLSLMVYVFFYQMAYPFSSTIFLYISFCLFALWLIARGKVYLSTQMLLMGLVTLVSVCGAFYTNNPEGGNREAVLTTVAFIFLVAFAQDEELLYKLKRIIHLFSLVVFSGMMLQFLLGDVMNAVLKVLLRADSYERLMWSYTVDQAYAGFSAYTVDAAYFCATLFGFMLFDRPQNGEIAMRKKMLRLAMMALSVFCVFLTSKRGVASALLIAAVAAYVAWKRLSAKTIFKIVLLALLCGLALYVLDARNAVVHLFLQRFTPTDGDVTTGRIEIWRKAISALQNEVIGMGTGAAYLIYDTGLHNIYLQLFYDHGMIGAAIYALFFAYNLISAMKQNDPLRIYIQMLVLAYGMSGNPIYSNSFFIVYVIFSVSAVKRPHRECAHSFEKRQQKAMSP